jgi:hypothetical protein
MNKKLQFLAISLLAGLMATAQTTIYTQTFEGTAFPTDWSRSTLGTGATAGWRQGANTALQSNSWPIPAHTKMVGTNDDACNCDLSADTLKSPIIDLTSQTSVALSFDLYFNKGTYQGATESAQLLSSTNGGSTWTVMEDFEGAANWTTIAKDISSLAGNANIRFAIVYNDGAGWTFGCAMDDFKVYVPLQFDLTAVSVVLPSFAGVNSPLPITGTLRNNGAVAVTSLTLNYTVDGGAPVTQDLTGLNIAPINGVYEYTHSTNYTPTTTGLKNIVVYATNINGNADQNTANDNVSGTVNVATQLVSHLPLLEGFTSSTCAPCASFYTSFDPILAANAPNAANNPGIANVKYQMNWPSPGNDPSYNADALARRTYYDVSGIPNNFYDGVEAASNTQSEIDFYKAKSSPVKIQCSYTPEASGKVTVNVNVTPYITNSSTTANKLFIAIMEKQYDYSASTTSQDVFKHVMRKMLPDGNGIALPGLVAGTEQTFTRDYTFASALAPATPAQNSFDLWTNVNNLEVVAFVQNVTTGEVYQAAVATLIDISGLNENNLNANINLFPNPVANDLMIALDVKNTQMTNIEIVNTLGQTIHSSNQGMISGSKVVRLDMSNFANGIYFAKVNVGGNTQTIKFNVAR